MSLNTPLARDAGCCEATMKSELSNEATMKSELSNDDCITRLEICRNNQRVEMNKKYKDFIYPYRPS